MELTETQPDGTPAETVTGQMPPWATLVEGEKAKGAIYSLHLNQELMESTVLILYGKMCHPKGSASD